MVEPELAGGPMTIPMVGDDKAAKATVAELAQGMGLHTIDLGPVRYARELAASGIRFPALRSLPTDEVVKTLVTVPGIGAWTAEIYAMFSLGRADVFAPGDLALQEAARLLFELEDRPREAVLRDMAEDWAPWRAVAARLLWAYYAHAKRREGVSSAAGR